MTSIAALKKVVNLVPSDSNGICYCTGSLGPTGDNLVKGIEELGNSIHFVHLRNIKGNMNQFRETWHDNGQKKSILTFSHGIAKGDFKIWDKSGNLVKQGVN